LTLRLDRKSETVFHERILETKPDEIIFTHRFKHVVLDGDNLVVTNKFDEPTFTVDLGSLA
jgi:hypothetical protein